MDILEWLASLELDASLMQALQRGRQTGRDSGYDLHS
jgi:hypothetical protein